ncbi:MAG: helix-turn-helix transcriptional regulator [Limnohabitans sp.]|jgi:HTH-type transcriptional regulator/antitoxin HipB|uniref:helix-turn-helix domain-containing protein n=1 Tax=Limnohabitans sp. TaxID=1907725 RepID=UPI0025E44A94|nr:helix-turn-helix transcriptional regulator [Limnohabitans sp.]MCO4087398.1 helix-turn-helix transcriptional regulator [Limnohabitans sp.]
MQQKLTTAQQVGHLLTASRKSQAMTQSQMAARLGISQARLSELEQSPGRLSVDRLLVLVNALGLELILRSPADAHEHARSEW